MEHLPGPLPFEQPVSIVRLHGLACFYCGAVARTLHAAGHITLPGQDRCWPVVTCGCVPVSTTSARTLETPAAADTAPGRGQR